MSGDLGKQASLPDLRPLTTGRLTWMPPAAKEHLEPGEVVLIVIEQVEGAREWTEAWFDSVLGEWVLCESGGSVDGQVLTFARVELPIWPVRDDQADLRSRVQHIVDTETDQELLACALELLGLLPE